MTAPTASSTAAEEPFRRDLENAFHRLRSALTEALGSVGADPGRARELGRQLAINKNLAWRATKIATARHAMEAVAHVPGPQAFGALVAALGRAGLAEAGQQALHRAHGAYRAMVDEHSSGDRAMLEQMAAGLGADRAAAERQEHGRRQAYLGMGGTWGVQARVQLLTVVLGPADPTGKLMDMVALSGFLGLRRLRPDARWTLFRRRRYARDHERQEAPVPSEPLDADLEPGDAPVLHEFCTRDMPALEPHAAGDMQTWSLPPGPVGHTAARDVLFGTLHRASVDVPTAENDASLNFWMSVTTPVEAAHYDLILHRDHPWIRAPRAELRSQLEGLGGPLVDDRAHQPLPLAERGHRLGSGLDSMASPHVPRYTDMLARVVARTGWEPQDFVGYRLVLPYPPIPSLLALRMLGETES